MYPLTVPSLPNIQIVKAVQTSGRGMGFCFRHLGSVVSFACGWMAWAVNTQLLGAAREGQLSVVEALVKSRANLETRKAGGRTPLSLAAEKGQKEVVELLLNNKAQIEVKDRNERTPISLAAEKGHMEVVQLLLDKNAKIESNARNIVFLAAENGHWKVVEVLVKNSSKREIMDSNARSLLFLAAEKGQLDVVRLLLDNKAQIEAKDSKARTPLSVAAGEGQKNVVELLLENNAEIEVKDRNERTPISLAAEKGHMDVVQLLLEKKAEIKDSRSHFSSALYFAADNGHVAVVKLFLNKSADIEAKDTSYAQTPLSLAAEEGHLDIVTLLLERKAEIETTDYDGQTPLSLAAEEGHLDIVTLLLERKAEIETTDWHERTPLSWAAYNGHADIVQLLLEENAKIDAMDENGRTPFSLAAENARKEVFAVCLKHIAEQGAWSLSQICSVIRLDNEDLVIEAMEKAPQDADIHCCIDGWCPGGDIELERESLRRAPLAERIRPVLAPDAREDKNQNAVILDRYLDFSKQNLFPARDVNVTLKILPGVLGSDAINSDFLQTLADAPHDAVFETDAVQAMILAAWQQERMYTWLEISSCITTVTSLVLSSYGFRHGLLEFATTTLCFAMVLHAKKTLDEGIQFIKFLRSRRIKNNHSHSHTYMTFDNFADLSYIASGWVAMYRQFFVYPSSLEKPWMALFSALSWLRVLYSLRGETWMGPRLLPIISAIKDTFPFFLDDYLHSSSHTCIL